MKKMKKSIAVFLALCVLFAAFPAAVSAGTNDGNDVSYIDADSVLRSASSCRIIDDSTRYISGWNVVYGEVETSFLALSDNAYLILTDNCVLRTGHLDVPQGKSLTIYAQSTDSSAMGKLYAQVDPTQGGSCAGIGGGTLPSESNIGCGNITINGGNITASGSGGAGIGGAMGGSAGSVTINGGIVTAYGSTNSAGIGSSSWSDTSTHHPGVVTINGGTVYANGGSTGAGVGGGYRCVGNVTVNGGTVNANGGYSAAGIGGGIYSGCDVTVNGGTVNATGGSYDSYGTSLYHAGGGAGIGSGGNLKDGSSAKITIGGGTVNAKGGHYAAGVGGGGFSSSFVTISGGKVIAEGGSAYECADIGNGYSRNENEASSVTIRGGFIISRNRVGGAKYDDTTPISIGWTDAYDHFYATEYNGVVTLENTPFIYESTREPVSLPLRYARTIIPALTVTYSPGEGTGHMDTEVTNPQLRYILPDNYFTAPEGTFFKGWLIDGKLYSPGDRYYPASDVTVTAFWKTPASVGEIILTPDCDITDLYAGDQFNISAEVLPEEADDKSLSWSSDNEAVAIVDENGRVWLRAVGEATIRATAKDGSETFAELTVTAKQGESLPYLDADGIEKNCHIAVELTDQTAWNDNSGGWYYADGSLTIDSRIYVSGSVSLILKNGCNFRAVNGICVGENASFTIYAQSKDPALMGALDAGNSSQKKLGGAGIGSNEGSFGEITINGGIITAQGYYNGPGLGGGSYRSNSTGVFNINGGIITATGGVQSAGIGTGYEAYSAKGIVFNINGGDVTANGYGSAWGIGGSGSGAPTINLSWSDKDHDRFTANSYKGSINLKKRFVYEDTGEKADTPLEAGRTIIPDSSVTVTVDCGDLADPITVTATYGETFFSALDAAGVLTALEEMETADNIFRELATKPLHEFSDHDELIADADALFSSSLTADITVYACFFTKIKTVTLFLSSPIAGQIVTVTDGVQNPFPEVLLLSDSHCYLYASYEWLVENGSEYEVFEGSFTAGETYCADCVLIPDFGYWLDDDTVVIANGGDVIESSGRMALSVSLSVTLPEGKHPLLGDVDGDGEVTIIDATLIQRRLASIDTPNFNMTAACVSGGELNITDATMIQRYLAGLSCPEGIGYPVA